MATTINGTTADGVVIWQGLDYGWRNNPHRMSRFDSHLDTFRLEPGSHVRARYLTDFGVGTVDDIGDAQTFVSALVAQGFRFVHGSQTKTITEELGTPVTVSDETVTISLPEPAGSVVATPLLRGLDLTCTSFDGGYQTRGFGIALDQPQQQGSALTFRPTFFLHPERSPDPFTRPPAPNTGPNQYEYQMTAYFTVLVAPAASVAINVAPRAVPTRIISYTGPTELPIEEPCEIVGQDGGQFPRAVIGIRGLQWQLKDFEGTRFDGRYLRRVQAFVNRHEYDPASGTSRFDAHLWFTNDGAITYAFHAEHRLWATLIQFAGGVAPSSATLTNVVATANGVSATKEFTL